MTRLELELIFSQLAKEGWEPRLCSEFRYEEIKETTDPMMCSEPYEQYMMLPPEMLSMHPTGAVTAIDNSMIDAGIKKGDTLIVLYSDYFEDGDVVLAYINGKMNVRCYCKDYDTALKPYIENLKAATGVIDCKEAKKLARKLKDECADFARQSQDRVFDNLSHRALVIAFRKACMLYVANGMKWEKSIETFCRWSLFYDLYIKMTVFGDLIRHADDDILTSKRGPQNLLELLPDEFTIEDAIRIRQQQGKNANRRDTMHMIRTWTNRGYCAQSTEHSFIKSVKYKKRGKGEI